MQPVNTLKSKLFYFITICIIVSVCALSDVNKQCIAENNGSTSNDFLLGTWYEIYQFKPNGPLPTCTCPNVTFTKPTQDELREYQEKFSGIELPHGIGDDAVVLDRRVVKGLILGQAEAKTFIIDPKSPLGRPLDGYEVYVYRRLSDKFVFFWRCDLRGHFKWLLTNDRDATEEEIQQIIKDRPEISNKYGERYCKDICY